MIFEIHTDVRRPTFYWTKVKVVSATDLYSEKFTDRQLDKIIMIQPGQEIEFKRVKVVRVS